MKKIVVAKGFCTPARDAITATLAPYGVRHTVQPYPDPLQNVATVIVSDRAAAWAEYLLLRSGRFVLRSKPIDRRNLKWAIKWQGAMPQPWVEPGCKMPQGQPSARQHPSRPRTRRRRWWQLF